VAEHVPRPEAWLQPLVGSPPGYRRSTRPLGGPGLALDDDLCLAPRSLTPKESAATGADIGAAHAAAPGLLTTRCATHGLVVPTIPLY
jgi:hypothetical protein